MTIDKEKLKALAEAMLRDEQGAELSGEEVRDFPEAVRSYEAMTAPSAVLALLAEIEQLAFEPAKHSRRLIDQLKAENAQLKNHEIELKAENEVLRKQVADLSPFKNASPQDYRASNKCLACGDYHHGLGNLPCPRCTPVAQSAMAKESSHD